MAKNKKDFAPTFGDLRENLGMGPCHGSENLTVPAKDRPQFTHPTGKQK